MTVDALRQYFRNLSGILQDGKGGAEVINDLAAIDRGLMPFAEYQLKSFAEFLEKAKSYDPNAVVPKPSPRPRNGGASRAPVDIEGISATVKHLYDTAANGNVTRESIEDGLKVLDALTKPQLITVAKGVKADKGLSAKNVAEVRDLIKDAVRNMWGNAQRVKQ